ncbi:MAG: DUF6293 family protein [Candidatus Methanomethylophilaceae archaeon]
MTSGKRDTVIISCVTFEVDKIVSPVLHYEAARVHLLNTSPPGDVYEEFYNEVCDRISSESPKTEIVPHRSVADENGDYDFTVYDFQSVMNEVLCIIEKEKRDCPTPPSIFVNISAGTSEYSAASLIASMMHHDVAVPFTVSAAEYTVPEDKVKEVYYRDGRPVGQTLRSKGPYGIVSYPLQRPDETRVLGLAVLKEQIEIGDTCAATMIRRLNEEGLFDDYAKKYNDKPEQKDIMKYQRNFMDLWLKDGWVEKVSKRKTRITAEGESILKVFAKGYRIGRRTE